jgi:hypothetical protein
MDESEPLMKCRENEQPDKTQWILVPGDKYSGNLFTGYASGVMEEA